MSCRSCRGARTCGSEDVGSDTMEGSGVFRTFTTFVFDQKGIGGPFVRVEELRTRKRFFRSFVWSL